MPIYPYPSGSSGSLDSNSVVSFANTVAFNAPITPVQITANTADYNPSGANTANVFRLNTDVAGRVISGIVGGSPGRLLILRNVGSVSFLLSHEDSGSVANNRFNFADSVNPTYRTIYPGRSEWLIYDASLNRWTDITPSSRTAATDIWLGSDDGHYITSLSIANSAIPQVLTPAANVSWNMANGYNANLSINTNMTINAPTGYRQGITYVLSAAQANGGLHSLSWASCYNFGQAGAPTLSTANGKVDIITAYCYDAVTPNFRMGFNRDT